MREQVERDLEVLYAFARLAERWWPESRRLRPVELVAEYEKTILNELDLMREAANAAQLRRNFEGDPKIYVPQVYWDYCRPSVMVMERIHGIPIDDMAALRAARVNIPRLAANGVAIFFTQVFRDNFFHADMHPGNIFVDARDPEHPKYCAVDFGIVGTLTDSDRRYLAENFLAFFDRDYHRVAQLHVDSRWVPPGTRVDEFESAIRSVCEPIFNKPLKDISFGQVLLRLFQTARQFNMEVQPQLMLLQKTLVQIEGLGRTLYPDLDLWETGQPGAEGLGAGAVRPAGDAAAPAAGTAGPALRAGEAAGGAAAVRGAGVDVREAARPTAATRVDPVAGSGRGIRQTRALRAGCGCGAAAGWRDVRWPSRPPGLGRVAAAESAGS